jgi:hypothetical protein
VEEALYRSRGYEPPVDDLPWQDDYSPDTPPRDSRSRLQTYFGKS